MSHDVDVRFTKMSGSHSQLQAFCFTCPWRGPTLAAPREMAEAEAERHRKATAFPRPHSDPK